MNVLKMIDNIPSIIIVTLCSSNWQLKNARECKEATPLHIHKFDRAGTDHRNNE